MRYEFDYQAAYRVVMIKLDYLKNEIRKIPFQGACLPADYIASKIEHIMTEAIAEGGGGLDETDEMYE